MTHKALLFGGPCDGEARDLAMPTQSVRVEERTGLPPLRGRHTSAMNLKVKTHWYTMHPRFKNVYIWEGVKPYPGDDRVEIWLDGKL